MADAVPPAVRAALVAMRRAGGRVSRAPGAGGPWPIAVVGVPVPTPDEGAAAVDLPDPAATLALSLTPGDGDSVAIEVTGCHGDLPMRARKRLVAAAAAAVASGATLATLPSTTSAALLPALRGCLEAYETTDAGGGSARRFAVVDPDAAGGLEVEAKVAAAAPRAPRPPPPPPTPEAAADAELRYLTRRFGDALALEPGSGDGGARVFELSVVPTDPRWPKARGPVCLRGKLQPDTYPAAGSFSLAPIPPSARGPAAARAAAASLLRAERAAAAAGDPRALRDLVKYVDACAAELDEAAAAAAGEGRADGPAAAGARFGLRLLGLALDGVDAVTPVLLRVQLRCGRCDKGGGAVVDLEPGGAAVDAACAACAAPATAAAVPATAFDGCNRVACIIVQGSTTPADLLPSTLGAQCGACGAVFAARSATPGPRLGRDCPACHVACRFRFEGVAFEREEVAVRVKSGATAPAAPTAPDAAPRAVPRGAPLPSLGTCAHYAHSHRWFRFPCCGRLYPCDLCHEEAADHPVAWAHRHVCGHCGREQSIGPACTACGKKLAGPARGRTGSRHWEGGRGCRDRARLDPRDAAKWRGSKAKTQSRKSDRVGEKGKERREEG